MSMTIIEKIFARKAGRDEVSAGDTVVVDDLVARNPSRAGCRVLFHRRLPDEV